MSYTEGYAENNGVKIFYRDYGPEEANPILLVHGLGAQLVHWPEHLIEFLIKNGLRPITFDNRDSGLSSRFSHKPSIVLGYLRYFFRFPIKPEYSLNDMARDGINLLNHLDIDKAHILGTSMGGMISQILCAKYPQRVKTYTLIASTASVPGPFNGASKEVRDMMISRSKSTNPSMDEVYQRELKWVGLIGMEGKEIDTPKFKEDTINNYNRIKDIKDGFGYARQLIAILSSKNRIKKVKSIQAKTLIIHGEQDPVLRAENSRFMHKLIPNSDLVIIENMRHLIEEEILDQFKAKLKHHLLS
ncbi:alpha/beta hydrolase [Gammaproteobacteria bacterium]|jgi:pimeloyl-ACP methyl ester carboxylesterase|nr:alpha/beta hydrolase [Gammaproteobacteria bacterium]MDA9575131.1 alpha/beta hydrolase [Gammaproteobacteria bacterium]MDB2503635.1 alpha/beta hydrolase [Gammaproteobacteria bacterium]MDC0467157.1 alpha/beta hydrolase [Gammaproteobacteria bacterium]MDC1008148.1 alpha/beta hydrolase [Gammaproteobacteria bacterium]